MRLSHRRDQFLILAFRFKNGFVGLRYVFLERDYVSQLTFALALQFLQTREIGLRPVETSSLRGKFDGEIFAGFGYPFHATKSLKISECDVEVIRGHRNRGG